MCCVHPIIFCGYENNKKEKLYTYYTVIPYKIIVVFLHLKCYMPFHLFANIFKMKFVSK